MHCPNCGQSQPSGDVRYCSRCGLSLWELANWLNGGANAPWNPIESTSGPSPRQKGIRRGAKLMFLSAVLFIPTLALAVGDDTPELIVLPLTIFFAGLAWALYCRLFSDAGPTIKQLPAHMHRANEYLPPAQVHSAPALRAREPNTAEIAQPPSVTEYTTNLLRNRNKT